MDEAGDIVAAEIGRVPPRLPQTAAASEAWAFHRAAPFMSHCLVACTDNASVVSNARPEAIPNPRHVFAGIYRSWLSRLREGTLSTRKVKGHCDLEHCVEHTQGWYDAVGNCAAHRLAKLGANMGHEDLDLTVVALKLASIADVAARIGHTAWHLWPRVGALTGLPHRPEGDTGSRNGDVLLRHFNPPRGGAA